MDQRPLGRGKRSDEMRTIELFSGTESFSQVMRKHGHETFTVDNDPQFSPDFLGSVLDPIQFPYQPDILWASPPCEGFSVASIGANWTGGYRAYIPKTDTARRSLELATRTLEIISELKPTWWFIENPRGLLRKMPFMEGLTRHTVWYCKYGDKRGKPTDIWTNATWFTPRPVCRNYTYNESGEIVDRHCHHQPARRGAKTGTQGVSGYRDRSIIPPALFEDIIEQWTIQN